MWDIDSHMRQTAVDWIFNPCDLQITISQKQRECIIITNKSHLQPRLGSYEGNKVVTCNNKFKVLRKTEKFNLNSVFYLNVANGFTYMKSFEPRE